MNRVEIITMLRDEYAGPNVTEARVRNLAEMTAHVPTAVLHKAAQEYMRQGHYFPRVNEFLRIVEAVTAAQDVEKRTRRDAWTYGRGEFEHAPFQANHEPISDELRFEFEAAAGLMRPAEVIEAEIAQARRQLAQMRLQPAAAFIA
ncbi:MAG: hypothetical protein H6661_09955 [Ardenticatenaceae bacterium]|nr:hypothetical protein [Ardenticatenaceae bacterium]